MKQGMRIEKNLIIEESSPKTPILESVSLDPHIKETMEVQIQGQLDDVMEAQVHVLEVKVMNILPVESRSSFGSLYMPFESENKNSNMTIKRYTIMS